MSTLFLVHLLIPLPSFYFLFFTAFCNLTFSFLITPSPSFLLHFYFRPVFLSFPPAFHLSSSRVPTLYYSAGLHRDTVKSPISRIPYRDTSHTSNSRSSNSFSLSLCVCVAPVSQYFCRNLFFLPFYPHK